jgi:HlyD family secretion protein
LLIAIAALIVALVAWLIISHQGRVAGIEASGTIEATESDLSPKVQGRLEDLRVRDGDRVRKGQIVAVLERLDPALDLDRARANVAAALAQVAAAQAAYTLQQATYATTLTQANEGVAIAQSGLGQAGENLDIERPAASLAVDQAQAQLVAAQAAYQHAQIDLARARSLVSTGDMSKQMLDDATNAYASAVAQLKAARDAVALADANRRNVQIRQLGVRSSRSQQRQSLATLESAKADRDLVAQRQAQVRTAQGQLAQARAALGLALDQVHETQVAAPFDGYVISHNFEVGDLVQPGSAVMTVGDLDHPYLYVYVSESDLPHVKLGTRVDVSIDGIPNRMFVGAVTEISNTAEFTPENVQTKQERIEYLVFRVKVQFTDTSGSLKPGLPADAVIHT